MIKFLENISINIRAKGPAAVMVVWIAAVTVLGIFGETQLADRALGLLAFFGGAVLVSLGLKPWDGKS